MSLQDNEEYCPFPVLCCGVESKVEREGKQPHLGLGLGCWGNKREFKNSKVTQYRENHKGQALTDRVVLVESSSRESLKTYRMCRTLPSGQGSWG